MKKRTIALSRRGKTLRNLALTLALLVVAWVLLGCPIPTARLRFRVLEWKQLSGPSEIVAQFDQEDYNGTVIVGTHLDQALVYRDNGGDGSLSYWPLPREGAALLPIYTNHRSPKYIDLLSLNAPEGAASAVLHLDLSGWFVLLGPEDSPSLGMELPHENHRDYFQESWSYEVAGQRQGSGEFRFRVEAHDQTHWADAQWRNVPEQMALGEITWSYRYTSARPGQECNPEFRARAVFYDESGSEVGTAVLSPLESTFAQ